MNERYIVLKAYIVVDVKEGLEVVDWFDDLDNAEDYAEELNEDYFAGIN